ncbi:ELWxxDGT repeat protein [Melittangium boletus]|uniref:Lipoprotein n=1 Tax=Melittangium boletus DSM 14713 TaxID=1294270 RepID=A0A250IK28_9BACT|nr:ELWxxDGT repeat protein [Melittangium boletus]ATB31570.1 hypothetical protein MEBOL_005033 [Melittangium boletus DSM 14713]
MAEWRGTILLCALMVGCGGEPATSLDEASLVGEPPEDSLPSEGSGNRDGVAESTPPVEPLARPALGTPYLVKDILPPNDWIPRLINTPSDLVDFQGTLFFTINFQGAPNGLWKSDGTEAGTVRVKEFTEGPDYLTPMGARLFFVAQDAAAGRELWISDGSSAGTRRLKDITPGVESSNPTALTVLKRQLLFFSEVAGEGEAPGRTQLWRSNGTEAGTQLVRDLGPGSSLANARLRVGDTLFFSIADPEHGTELWKTDGTAAGTVLVRDIVPGTGSAYPNDFQSVGASLFFLTTTPSSTRELWRSDGTAAGTQRIRQFSAAEDLVSLHPGTGHNLFLAVTRSQDHLLRLSSLEVDNTGGVRERRITTLPNPYADQPDADAVITTATVAGTKFFFSLTILTSGPAPRDVQLWVSNGTASGTRLVSRPLSLSDEFSSELYTLDDRILFSKIDEATGLEPWVSDGTEGGTRLVQDIAPGETSSYTRSYLRVGSRIFFVAYEPVHGNELWAIPLQD